MSEAIFANESVDGLSQSQRGGVQPVGEKKRIASIDVLRGVALLGILPMNIEYFSTIAAAYFNPTAYGNLNGANCWVWLLLAQLLSSRT